MNDRRNRMVELINSSGSVSFGSLKTAFPNVSEMTLRNDLKYLDAQHLIVRVHGGAKSVENIIGTDGLLNIRLTRNMEKKKIIAEKAVEYIYPGSAVFLDSGSTLIELAKKYPDQSGIVFTTGLHCAIELGQLEKPKIYLLGGQLNRSSMSISGSMCLKSIEQYNYNIAFMGVTGYMKESGFNCGAAEESELKKNAMARADTVIMLMDSSKVGVLNPFVFASIKDIDVVITDDELDPEIREYFLNNNIKVI
jgi:DeoR family transcriptional regulator of aga operon